MHARPVDPTHRSTELISNPLSHRCWLGTSFDQYGHCLSSERQLEVTQSIVKFSGIFCSRIVRGSLHGPQPHLSIRKSFQFNVCFCLLSALESPIEADFICLFLPRVLGCEEAWIRESHKRQMICEPTGATCKAVPTSSEGYMGKEIDEMIVSIKVIKETNDLWTNRCYLQG